MPRTVSPSLKLACQLLEGLALLYIGSFTTVPFPLMLGFKWFEYTTNKQISCWINKRAKRTGVIFSGMHIFGIYDTERQVMRNDEMWGFISQCASELPPSHRLGVYKMQQLPPATLPRLVKMDWASEQQWWNTTSSLMLSKEEYLGSDANKWGSFSFSISQL